MELGNLEKGKRFKLVFFGEHNNSIKESNISVKIPI